MPKNTVTQEQVNENMQDVSVQTLEDFGKKITHVSVRMKNGFVLTEDSICVDPANYDEEIGKQVCLSRIENKVWFLLGYALQDKLSKEVAIPKELAETIPLMCSDDYKQRFRAEYFQNVIRYDRLYKMVEKWDKGELEFTPTCPREIYDRQLSEMGAYLSILEERAKLEDIDIKTE